MRAPLRSPHAVQHEVMHRRCGVPVRLVRQETGVPGLQRITFVLRCARDTMKENVNHVSMKLGTRAYLG